MRSGGSSAEECLRALRVALRRQRWARAEKFAGLALAAGSGLPRLKQAFIAAGKLELLLQALWDRRDSMFTNFGAVAWFAGLAASTDMADEYLAKLQHWALANTARCSFGLHDYLAAYEGMDQRAFVALFCLKHGAWTLPSSGDVLRTAAEYSDRVHVAPPTAEFFFHHCRETNLDFAAWLREFKTTQMLYHLYCDGRAVMRLARHPDPAIREMAASFCRVAILKEYMDMGTAKRLFEGLDRSRGLLLCTFHGGFLKISRSFLVRFMPDAVRVAIQGEENPNVIPVRDNERAAAFGIFKALREGRPVLMAPDGTHHGSSSGIMVEVLGLKTTIAEGSAMLAYESGCNTGWITAVRRGAMFLPDYVPGPRRVQSESYKAFRDRWLAFYVERIEQALSSGPENLVPMARWATPYTDVWSA